MHILYVPAALNWLNAACCLGAPYTGAACSASVFVISLTVVPRDIMTISASSCTISQAQMRHSRWYSACPSLSVMVDSNGKVIDAQHDVAK